MSINYNDRKTVVEAKKEQLFKVTGRDDLIPVWGESIEAPIANSIQESIKQFIDKKALFMTDEEDSSVLSFMNWERTQYNLSLRREWICYAPCGKAAVAWITLMLTRPEDRVLSVAPTCFEIRNAVEENDRHLLMLPLNCDGRKYALDLDRLEETIRDENIKLVYLSNPQNPTGKLWTESELARIVECCKKYNTYLIADERYQDFVWEENKYISALLAGGYDDHIAVLCGAAESFNLPDLTGTFVILPGDELRARYKDFAVRIGVTKPSILSCIATNAAYKFSRFWQSDVKDMIYSNYLLAYDILDKKYKDRLADLQYAWPEGGYQLWIDFSAYFAEEDNFLYFLDEICGVAVNLGIDYGKDYGICAAINLGADKESIEIAIKTIAENLIMLNDTEE